MLQPEHLAENGRCLGNSTDMLLIRKVYRDPHHDLSLFNIISALRGRCACIVFVVLCSRGILRSSFLFCVVSKV